MRFFRKIWCRWFHKKAHQLIEARIPFYSYYWCWLCEEEVK